MIDIKLQTILLQQLQQGLQELNLSITEQAQKQLIDYLGLLIKWNQAYNLTAIRDPEIMVIKHLLDSLVVVPFLEGERFLDVGTGPGLPGILLALAMPQQQFVLLDSNTKKIQFLLYCKGQLKLDNVQIIHSRIEDYQPEHCFDGIISRAFSRCDQFVALTQSFCCPSGHIYAMKGLLHEDEWAQVKGMTVTLHRLQVPGLAEERHLVVFKRASHE